VADREVLAESGDKLPADSKTEINEALGELRSAWVGPTSKRSSRPGDAAQASQKAGSLLYAQGGAAASPRIPPGGVPGAAGATGASGAPGGAKTANDDVVDAEIVDEDDKK